MRRIEPSTRFRRDHKREKKGQHAAYVEQWIKEVVDLLAADKPLAARYRDHDLTGDWKDHRDCHIRPDLILIYRKSGDDALQLVRLGSYNELGL